jgi:hypothetical protein
MTLNDCGNCEYKKTCLIPDENKRGGYILSEPYQSRTAAKEAAKRYAKTNGIKHFILLIDAEKKQFYFSNADQAPIPKLIVFARYALIKSKWQDKTPLAQVTKGG